MHRSPWILAGFLCACSTTPTAPPGDTPPSAPADPNRPDLFPVPAGAGSPMQVTVRNLDAPCRYALYVGESLPFPETPSLELPTGDTVVTMYPEEHLAVQSADGHYGIAASVDKDGGGILVHDQCRSISASDSGVPDWGPTEPQDNSDYACCKSIDDALRVATGCTVARGAEGAALYNDCDSAKMACELGLKCTGDPGNMTCECPGRR